MREEPEQQRNVRYFAEADNQELTVTAANQEGDGYELRRIRLALEEGFDLEGVLRAAGWCPISDWLHVSDTWEVEVTPIPNQVIIMQDEAQEILGPTTGGKTSASDLVRRCRNASVSLPDHPDTISWLRTSWRLLLTSQDGEAPGAVVRETYRLYEQRESGEGHVEVGLALREAERDALSTTDRQLWAELGTGRAAHRGICTFVLRAPDRHACPVVLAVADHFVTTGRNGCDHEF